MLDGVVQPAIAVELVPVPREEPGGAERLGVVGLGLVGGEHLDDHPVVALVGVERLDDPVAPAPDVGLALADLLLVAVPVAIPPDVHPVPPPALAILRAVEEAIDHLLVGVIGGVGEEGEPLFGGGDQADQVEVDPAEERPLVGVGARPEPARLVLGGEERVDRVADPCRVLDLGDLGTDRRLEGPVRAGVVGLRLVGGLRPGVDPRLQPRDLLGRERLPLSRRGHPPILVAGDGVDEQALGALAGDDRRASVPPGPHVRRGVEPQPRVLLQRPVAGDAPPAQERLDVADVIHPPSWASSGPGSRSEARRTARRVFIVLVSPAVGGSPLGRGGAAEGHRTAGPRSVRRKPFLVDRLARSGSGISSRC